MRVARRLAQIRRPGLQSVDRARAGLCLALASRLWRPTPLGRRAGSINVRGLDMIRRDELSEYVRGSLWVLPTLSVLAALVAGALLSLVKISSRSPLAFQGTADDADRAALGAVLHRGRRLPRHR